MKLFRRDGHSERVERLLEETNALLRELLLALGRTPTTRAAARPAVPTTPRTAEDVTVMTRQRVIEVERERALKDAAPWRSGPVAAPAADSGGQRTSAGSSRPAPDLGK